MINKLFLYFASARYLKAMDFARQISGQSFSQRERSFLILTASLAELFQGEPTKPEDSAWKSDLVETLQQEKPETNEFLTLLMGLEGSKLFQAETDEGEAMLQQAWQLCRTHSEQGGILFFRGVFTMNRTGDYGKAAEIMLQARQLLEANHEYSLFTLMRFWNETMLAHVSHQMEQYRESEILSRQTLLQSRTLGLDALLENSCFNLAFAHQGMGNAEKAEEYLQKNADFWKQKNNPHKYSLAIAMAAVILLQMGEQEKGKRWSGMLDNLEYQNAVHRSMVESISG